MPWKEMSIMEQKESFIAKMIRRFDTSEGRSIYSKRMGTVEPVFGHLRGTLHLDRFTVRSKKKATNQWLLYFMFITLVRFRDME